MKIKLLSFEKAKTNYYNNSCVCDALYIGKSFFPKYCCEVIKNNNFNKR